MPGLTPRLTAGLERVSRPLWVGPSGTQGAWEEIARSVLGSAAASISFQSIPTEYRMFRVELYGLCDATTAVVGMTLNNDTGANYDYQLLSYDNTTNGSSRQTGAALVSCLYSLEVSKPMLFSAVFGKPLAANEATGIYRWAFEENTSSAIEIGVGGFVWNNTADLISRVDITRTATNFDTGSVAVLYGNKT